MKYSAEINSLNAIDLWNHGTVELSSGSIPLKDSFCGQCWLKLKNETPGERIIDWKFFKDDIKELLNALDYYKIDKKQEDYMFLQKKLIECEIAEKGLIKENVVYSDVELSALYMIPKGNRLEIPQGFLIGNYKALKKLMSNFDGKYRANGFDFKYPAEKILKRISNQETINLKKKFQFFGTSSDLCEEILKMTLDPNLKRSVKILEPSAGQGAFIDAIQSWHLEYSKELHINSITAIEFMEENYSILKNKYGNSFFTDLNIISKDFLLYDEYINYFDYVIANPPFSKGQDMEHFRKMYEVCKPGGVVTSIMSTAWLQNTGKKYIEFRKWLGIKEAENWIEKLNVKSASKGYCDYEGERISATGNVEKVTIKTYEAGRFKEAGTNVITCLLQLKKQELSGFDFQKKTGQQKLF